MTTTCIHAFDITGVCNRCQTTIGAVEDAELNEHYLDAKAMTLEESPSFFSDTFHHEPVNTKEYWSTLQVSAMLGCVAFGAVLALGVMYSARVGLL